MTNPEYRSTRSTLTLAVALLACTAFIGGCDTVAEISFQSRNLAHVQTTGFISAPGEMPKGSQCGTLGSDRQAKTNLRFMLLDDQSPTKPYIPGTGTNISVGEDLEVTLSNGRIFEPQDVACMGDGACTQSNYTCTDPLGSMQSRRRCGRDTTFDQGPIRFISSRDEDNVLGVVVEHGASTSRGQLPDTISGRWYDTNGDGMGDTQPENIVDARKSDPSGDRIAALASFNSNYAKVAENASDGRDLNSFYGLWALNNGGNFVSAINQGQPDTEQFWTQTQDTGTLDDFRTQLGGSIEATNNLVRPFEALYDLINGPFAQERFDSADKSLFLIVDGPPEIPLSASGNLTLPDDTIQTAIDNDIRVHIIHYDPPVNDLSALPDSQQYWTEQTQNCSSDQDCRDWETCREVQGFSDNQGGQVSPEPSGTYCMPERRQEDGRFGPISAYGRLACATGGSYQYLKSPLAIERSIRFLPFETDGMWEAELEVDEVNSGNVEPNGPTRVQANVEFQLTDANQTESWDFSQEGLSSVEGGEGAQDNRSTLFIGDVN